MLFSALINKEFFSLSMSKRSLLTLLFLLGSLSLQAQWGISADCRYATSQSTYSESGLQAWNDRLPNSRSLSFSPRVFYCLSSQLQVGLDLSVGNSISTSTHCYYDPVDELFKPATNTQQTRFTAALGLYARQQICVLGSFALHLEAEVLYAHSYGIHTSTIYNRYDEAISTLTPSTQRQWQLSLTPVATYMLGQHCCLHAYLHLASLAYAHTTTLQHKSYLDEYPLQGIHSISRTHQLLLGIQSSGGAPISLGFSYLF